MVVESEDDFYARQAREQKRDCRIKIARELGLVLNLSRSTVTTEEALQMAEEGYYAYVRAGGCIWQMNNLDHPRLDSLVDAIFPDVEIMTKTEGL